MLQLKKTLLALALGAFELCACDGTQGDTLPITPTSESPTAAVPVFQGHPSVPIRNNSSHATQGPEAPPVVRPEMVSVSAGTFGMGCKLSDDNTCRGDELPYHMVTLASFSIDRLEVTQADYQKCIAANECRPPAQNFDPVTLADHPVRDVPWEMADAYCRWAGKRLPTEAEWEKAARGDSGQKYPWGGEPADCTRANYNACGKTTIPSGSLSAGASPFGALDMSGNVWEWVSDWYQFNYYIGSPANNPVGPASGTMHTARGGGYGNDDWPLRASARITGVPNTAYDQIGFRCAR